MQRVTPFLNQIRNLSTKHKLAVIGSGPSAFYTVLNILKDKPNDFEIDMFEKNPSPFGLVRYGVAPDHPEVKNCIDRFNEIKDFIPSGTFKYFGNVPVSETAEGISLKDIYKNYNGVLYAYGSSIANVPDFPGIEHPAVIDSYTFVNWYNGHPKFSNLKIPLDKVSNVSIIGNGNVALDIVRILLAHPEAHWSTTDIAREALETLRASTVKNVNVIARRGVLDSKFSNKELRELLELKNVHFDGYNREEFDGQLKEVKLDRINKRRISLLDKYVDLPNEDANRKTWNLQYLKSPIGVKIKDNELLSETIFKLNKMEKDADGNWKVQPKGKLESVPNDLLILATGYKCEPLGEFDELDIPFENGKIKNNNGKIETSSPNSYCVGWVSNGSQGNINSTVVDSMNVAATIVNDSFATGEKEGRTGIEKIMKEKGIKAVTWDEWNSIHQEEIKRGAGCGKPYEKMKFSDMLQSVLDK